MMCPEPDVSKPARTRSASFSSVVADLLVGGDPAAKVMALNPNLTIEQLTAQKPELSEKLRNAVQSSVNQAKRRVPGSQYSIEISDIALKSGVYLVAVVTRNA
jgi:hypothetical protein